MLASSYELVFSLLLVFLLRNPQTMAKRTRTRLRESQLFFTRFGLNICDVKDNNEGITMKINKMAMTNKSTRRRPGLRRRDDE